MNTLLIAASTYSENTQGAIEYLRNPGATMQWYIIPILLIFIYIVSKELSEGHTQAVLAGAALWLVDIWNEIWNSYICAASGWAPVWGTPPGVGLEGSESAFNILIGYNIEISFMFFIMGIASCLMLPKDKKQKILGINNRIFFAVIMTTLAVCVECFLNYAGVLTWEWSFWQRGCPWLLWVIGYLPFFAAAYYTYDRPTVKGSVKTVGCLAALNVVGLIVGAILNWI
ncbi:MAG: hypothetical protein MJ111_01525 [Clostridia bacterium]|nr:hypothetical protein [Candidatus Limimonas egerieequi]MCQ2489222.1 hypothetical protein [Clostridia bacterium]